MRATHGPAWQRPGGPKFAESNSLAHASPNPSPSLALRFTPSPARLRRSEIQAEIKRKEKARAALAHKYKTRQVSEDELLHCIYSISDNNSYLFFNRDPIDKAITYLTTFFSPTAIDGPYSLAIQSGAPRERASHDGMGVRDSSYLPGKRHVTWLIPRLLRGTIGVPIAGPITSSALSCLLNTRASTRARASPPPQAAGARA